MIANYLNKFRSWAKGVSYVIIRAMQRSLRLHITVILLLSYGCASTPDLVDADAPDSDSVIANSSVEEITAEPEAVNLDSDSLLSLLEAEFAIRAREYDLALQRLQPQVQKISDPELARRMLRLAQFTRQQQATLIAAGRVSDLDPSDADASTLAAALAIESGEILAAATYAERALLAGSDLNIAALLNDFDAQDPTVREALEATINRLSEQLDNPDIQFAKALLLWRLGDGEASRAVLATFAETPVHERATLLWTEIAIANQEPNALDRLSSAIEETDSQLLRYQYARFLVNDGDLTAASAQFDRLVNKAPRNSDYLLAAGILKLELDELGTAVSLLETAANLGQRLDEARFYLAVALERSEQSARSLDTYLSVSPSRYYSQAMQSAANLAAATKTPAAITTLFQDQRNRHPAQSELLFLLEAGALQSEAPDQAILALSKGLEALPNSERLLYSRATVYDIVGDFESAEMDFRYLLELKPNDPTALNALGYLMTNNTDRYAEAAALIEAAFQQEPQNPAIIDSLGWAYFKLGRFNEAEILLRQAYQSFPDPEVAAHLLELLWSQGRRVEASDLIDTEWAKSPNNPHLVDTAARLDIPLP